MEQAAEKQSSLKLPLAILFGGILLFVFIWLFRNHLYIDFSANIYLLFHNFVEIFSIVTAAAIFGLAWQSYPQTKSKYILFLGCAFLGMAILDFVHTMSMPGMPDFITSNAENNKSILLWLAARLMMCAAFLGSAILLSRDSGKEWRRWPLLASIIGVTAIALVIIIFFPGLLPQMFVAGQGLTLAKDATEFLIIVIIALAAYEYWRNAPRTTEFRFFQIAFALIIFSELSFTLYKGPYDTFNALGHAFKLFEFIFIYAAVFGIALEGPYKVLEENIARRETAETALQKTSSLLEGVFESVHVLIAYLDKDLNFVRVNKAYAALENKPPEYYVGRHQPDLYPDKAVEAMMRETINTGKERVVLGWKSHTERHPEWGITYWDMLMDPIKNAKGETEGLVLSFLNVTEAKNTELKLASALRYARSLLEASLDPLVTIGTDGKITDVNEATERATGYSRTELVGTWFSSYFSDPQKAEEGYKEVFRLGEVRDYPLELKHKNGQISSVLYNATVYKDVDGKIAGVFAAARDITKLKEYESELSANLAILKMEQEESLDGIIIVDAQDNIISSNNKFAEIWNIPKNILTGGKAQNALASVLNMLDDPQAFVERINYLYAHTEERSQEEIHLKDGRTLERYSAPLKLSDGKYLGRIWFYRDITERKNLDRARTEFVSMASHQLRTPLAAVKWYSEMLSDKRFPISPKQKKYIEEIVRGNERMIRLVNALLNISRIEMGALSVHREEVDVPKLAKDIVNEHKTLIEHAKVDVDVQIDGKPKAVLTDPALLHAVIQNLLTNAVKYTPSKGSIKISIRFELPGVKIEVADTGIGIPKGDQSRIFDKLFRGENALAAYPEGTGLGLYIVSEIIKLLDSKVEFESEENKGSRFWFTIPYELPPKPDGQKQLIVD